jgi:hypothetical protein
MFSRMVEDQRNRGDVRVFCAESKVRMAPPPEQVEWGPDMDVEETDDDIFMIA